MDLPGAEQGRYPLKVPLILPVAGAAAGLVSPNATRRNVEPWFLSVGNAVLRWGKKEKENIIQ